MKTTNPVDAARIELLLSDLRLPAIKLMWAKFAEQSDKEGWPAARFLAALAEHEIADRGRRRIERHLVEARLPVGKTLANFDFEAVPTSGAAHDLSLFMEDTAWPFAGGLSRYLTKCATLYADQTLANQKKEGTGIIELEAAFQPVWGSHKTNEVVLWQRVVNHKALLWMLANDLPPAATAPGTWMHDALALRDQWQSRLLRSAAWSPLY